MSHFCLFSYEIYPFTRGGAGTYITSSAIRLTALGHMVTLVLDIDDQTFAHCKNSIQNSSTVGARIILHKLSSLIGKETHTSDQFPSEAHWKSYLFSEAAEAIHASNPIDVLEFVDYCGPAYYSILRRAVSPDRMPPNIVVRMHNTIEIIDKCAESNFLRSRVYDYWLERTSITLADRILSPGKRYWNEIAATLYKIPPERVIISPPCRTLLPRVTDGVQGKNIVFVGRISTIKGMDVFLQAMSTICADAKLTSTFKEIRIIGPGESIATQDEAVILSYGKDIPPNKITFLGNLDESALVTELSEAQIAIFPNRCESFCYAAHEAHLAGVPLILSEIPAFLDHFSDRASAIFFDGTAHSLADKVRELLLDESLRKRLSSSILSHRARYESMTYGAGLSAVQTNHSEAIASSAASDAAAAGTALTIVYFCSSDKSEESRAFLQTLTSTVSASTLIVLVESKAGGSIFAFGKGWDCNNSQFNTNQLIQRGYIVFTSDEFLLAPSFIERGLDMLARMPSIGAVLPVDSRGTWGLGEFGIASDLFSIRLDEPLSGFPLIIRSTSEVPLQQILRDRTSHTALSLLMNIRACGFTIIDDILPSATKVEKERLFLRPTHNETAAFVKRNLSNFRDYELASNLVDTIQSRPAAHGSEHAAPTLRQALRDLHSGAKDHLYIHIVDGVFSIISVLDIKSGAQMTWGDIDVTGPHQFIHVRDRSAGILELFRGSRLRIERGTNLLFNAAIGPNNGTACLIYNHRSALISAENLSQSHRFFMPHDLLAITEAAPFEVPPRAFHLSAYFQESRRPSHHHATIGVTSIVERDCLFVASERDRERAETLVSAKFCVVLKQDAKSLNALIDEISSRLYHLGTKTASFFGQDWLDLIEQLLSTYRKIHAEIIFPPNAVWAPAIALKMLRINDLKTRFRQRVSLAYPSALAVYLPAAEAETAYTFFSKDSSDKIFKSSADHQIRIIIDRNPADEFYMGHVAAITKILYAESINISDIYIPAGQQSQDRLFEFFGLSHLVRNYDSFMECDYAHPGPTIYINPFPFGENMHNLRLALLRGWHTVISPYEFSLLGNPDHLKGEIVPYWEDVELIASRLIDSLRKASSIALP